MIVESENCVETNRFIQTNLKKCTLSLCDNIPSNALTEKNTHRNKDSQDASLQENGRDLHEEHGDLQLERGLSGVTFEPAERATAHTHRTCLGESQPSWGKQVRDGPLETVIVINRVSVECECTISDQFHKQ